MINSFDDTWFWNGQLCRVMSLFILCIFWCSYFLSFNLIKSWNAGLVLNFHTVVLLLLLKYNIWVRFRQLALILKNTHNCTTVRSCDFPVKLKWFLGFCPPPSIVTSEPVASFAPHFIKLSTPSSHLDWHTPPKHHQHGAGHQTLVNFTHTTCSFYFD